MVSMTQTPRKAEKYSSGFEVVGIPFHIKMISNIVGIEMDKFFLFFHQLMDFLCIFLLYLCDCIKRSVWHIMGSVTDTRSVLLRKSLL